MKPRSIPVRRTRIKARGRTKGGRGSLPEKVKWLHGFGCDVCGAMPVEVHHDRHLGSRGTDRKTVPLCAWCHREGPESLHVLGRARFQEVHGYDFDARCQFWQAQWEERNGER